MFSKFHSFKVSKSQDFEISTNQKWGAHMFQNFRKNEFHISIDHIFQDVPRVFLDLFEVFWYNKMKTYDFQDLTNKTIMEFRNFDV